jgi:hypothetical protein
LPAAAASSKGAITLTRHAPCRLVRRRLVWSQARCDFSQKLESGSARLSAIDRQRSLCDSLLAGFSRNLA